MPGMASSPRVAVVAAGSGIIGGHSVQAAALADGLQREGLDVVMLAINRPFPRGLRRAHGMPVVKTAVNQVLYAMALRALRGVDVAHVFSASYWSFLLAPVPAMLAAKRAGARVVLHYHSGEVADHLDHWGWRVHPWLDLADEIVVCSRFQQDVFARHGRAARVIPNIVDGDRFAFRARSCLRLKLLSNRNLEPYYRIDRVVRAFAAIHAARPEATLTIAGSGSEEARLRALVAANGTRDRVSFVGAVAPDQMPSLLDGHDVLLNASVVDNQPVSLIEAMAAGVLVVSTPTGGIAEMIEDGVTGRVVPAGDINAMAQAVLRAVDVPAEAEWMTRGARVAAQRYHWQAVWPRWQEVYAFNAADSADLGTPRVKATGIVAGRP